LKYLIDFEAKDPGNVRKIAQFPTPATIKLYQKRRPEMAAGNAGRVALVTGSGQGIGKGIAKWLVEEGMQVVIADIDAEAAQNTAAEFFPS
jgi:5,10-methylene-tetrahydrofolate dehydrogenase/methenyl tetrahydrofolate cyclohydrolase